MKIVGIELIPVKVPYVKPIPIHVGINKEANNLIVIINTDEGEYGLGEVSPLIPSYSGETQETAIYTIYKTLGPNLIGKDPTNIESIWNLMDNLLLGHTCAKSGLDIALHDLKAKSMGIPVYNLFGEKLRGKLPILWTISWGGGNRGMIDDAVKYLKKGYRHLKVKIGSKKIEDDVERVKAIREVSGEIPLIADANQAYSVDEAVKIINALKNYIEVLEQPLPRWDILGYKYLTENSEIPIMVDESVPTPQEAMNFAQLGACKLFLIKLMRSGGFFPTRKIVEIAKKFKIGCIACSMTELGIGTAANAHFACSTEYLIDRFGFGFDGPLQIFGITESKGFDMDIVEVPPKYKNGNLYVPKGPGLGVELHEENIEKYRSGKTRKLS